LLGESGTTLKAAVNQSVVSGAKNPQGVKTLVFIEIFVFNGDGGLAKIKRDIVKLDRRAALVDKNVVNGFLIAVQDFGGKTFAANNLIGRGQVPGKNGQNQNKGQKSAENHKEGKHSQASQKLGGKR